MKIIFYDVEHGSCCHIITPNNQHILVDVGSKTDSSIVEHINEKYFRNLGGQIDELIITHPHEDHIYDLPKLYEILPPRVLRRPSSAFDIIPSQNTPTHIYIAYTANTMNKNYNRPVQPRNDPTNYFYNGGIEFKIIEPKDEWTTKDDLNTFSSIIVVTYKNYKFVLTGDNPASILQKMMDLNYGGIREAVRDAEVLLAPHHGRSNEFCHDFFDCVNPAITVVSDKSIIHKTQADTAALYQGRGFLMPKQERYVLTTRKDGTISFDISNSGKINNIAMGEEDY